MFATLTIKVLALASAIHLPNQTITQAGVYEIPQRDFYACLITMNQVDAFNEAHTGNKVLTACK